MASAKLASPPTQALSHKEEVPQLHTQHGRELQLNLLHTAARHASSGQLISTHSTARRSKVTVKCAPKDGGLESERLEVQGLTDLPVRVEPVVTGVADRINDKRRRRHDKTLQDMKQALSLISEELEPRIAAASTLVKSQLAGNDMEIESIFGKVITAELIQGFSLARLEGVWREVKSQTMQRQGFVQQLDSQLCEIEQERSSQISSVLCVHSELLEAIGHLLPAEVERLVEEEAHTINLTIVANRRCYAQLCMHLLNLDLVREREQRSRWEGLVKEWRELVVANALEDFRCYMQSDVVQHPASATRVKVQLSEQQAEVNAEREGLLQQLGAMRPPQATKAAIHAWTECVGALNKRLGGTHSLHLLRLQESQAELCQQCELQLDRVRDGLLECGAFDSETVYDVMSSTFVPLVEEHLARAREELHRMERSLDGVLSMQEAQFQALSQFSLGLAHIWDTHSAAYAQVERDYQGSLEQCRLEHDVSNQNLEANLDVLLDRLRQGNSEQALQEYLSEALKMLDTIKEGYLAFHGAMLSAGQQLPGLGQEVLATYEKELCRYLGVGRKPQKQKKKPHSRPSDTSLLGGHEGKASKKSKSGRMKTTPSFSRASSVASGRGSALSAIVEEVISTSHGTSFYVHASSSSVHPPPEAVTFLTQDEESEGTVHTFATENLLIPDKTFTTARNELRVSFLDHMEKWKAATVERAVGTVAGKEEEAHTELDLRLHLHEPRASRVEEDIHNVRAVELLAHRDRVSRHTQAVVSTVTELKEDVQSLSKKQEKLREKFCEEMAAMEEKLVLAGKCSRLLKAKKAAEQILEDHLSAIEELGRCHQISSEDTLSSLASSNNSFRSSLKLFSEGGNYCPEEVEPFAKKMDKLTAKIARAQTFIVREVECITNTHKSTAEETMNKFQANYRLHCCDVSYLEEVERVFTHVQVEIKSEVAASNTQARGIFEGQSKLRRMLDDCSQPSHDGAAVSPADIISELPVLFDLLSVRRDYLYCKLTLYQGARVGFHAEVSTSSMGSGPTKATVPISAVNVTRSILQHTDPSKMFGPDTDITGRVVKSAMPSSSGALGSLTSVDTKSSGASADEQKRAGRQSRRKQPEIERKNISFGVGGGEPGSNCLLPRIRGFLKQMHLELYTMTEAYYKQKSTRLPTHPEEIHESFESCMDALIERYHSYRQQAEDYRNDCIEEYSSQLDSILSVLLRVPLLVMERVRQRHWQVVEEACGQATATYHKEIERLEVEKRAHECALCPTLGHPQQREQLQTLCSQEEARYRCLEELVHSHCMNIKELQSSHAKAFVSELVETTRSLLSLFDSVIISSEIAPGSDKLKAKPAMEALLRELVRPQQSSESAPQSKATPNRGTWPGLPAGEGLHVIWGEAVVMKASAAVARGLEGGTTPVKSVRAATSSLKSSTMSKGAKKGSKSSLALLKTAKGFDSSHELVQSVAATLNAGSTLAKSLRESIPPSLSEEDVLQTAMEDLSSSKVTAVHEAVLKSRNEVFHGFVSVLFIKRSELERGMEERLQRDKKWNDHWRASVEKVEQLYQQ